MKVLFFLLLALALSGCTKYNLSRDNKHDPKSPNYVTPHLICSGYSITSTDSRNNKLIAGDRVDLLVCVKNIGTEKAVGIQVLDIMTANADDTIYYFSKNANIGNLNPGDSGKFSATIDLIKVPVSGPLYLEVLMRGSGRIWRDTLILHIEKLDCKIEVTLTGPFTASPCYTKSVPVKIENHGPDYFYGMDMDFIPLKYSQYVSNIDIHWPRYPIDIDPNRNIGVNVEFYLNCNAPKGIVIPFKMTSKDWVGNVYDLGTFSFTVN